MRNAEDPAVPKQLEELGHSYPQAVLLSIVVV